MQNLLEQLKTTLQNDERLVVDGNLVKNKIVELALAMDAGLLALLLGNETIKKQFFKQVGGVLVFDKVALQSFVSNKQFLPDSYTAFKNKIGLTANGEYLTESREVVLAWPYKDCTLEGGQTKEEQKRKEIFWNETLAADEIDRLLDPKVLTHFKKYDKDGAHKAAHISLDDNLIIKGNNLLALHSLKKQYAGKVKLIYIDPPYNTGSDSFGYNDSFNHSTWLTFMRNRLEVSRELLRGDGVIFVQCDDNEQAYLKVLMDEVFGRKNFVADFIWHHRKSSQNDIDVSLSHNYTLTFAKNRKNFKLNILGIDGNKFSNLDDDPRGDWVADPFDAPNIRKNLSYEITNPNTHKIYLPPKGRCWRMSKDKYEHALKDNRIIFGKSGKTKPQYKRFKDEAEEKGRNAYTIWNDTGTATEGTKELMKLFDDRKFTTPKPEKLLQRIIEISTKESDIVLDYHLGSGTTCAVAHKMGRRYIGIEQMDYIHDVTCERLKKVIQGEQGGISKSVNWQGGDSFTYCELAQHNANIIDKIEQAKTTQALTEIWQEIENADFISYKIKPEVINKNIHEFAALSVAEQKQFLIAVLDKNQLYVNYSEIDDVDYQISNEDKALNRQFYGG